MVLIQRLFVAICLWSFLAASSAAETNVIKIATLMPKGTGWMNLLEEWGKAVDQESQGRLKIKLYPGGIMGDEPDVLRKMHRTQLQGGVFTGYGIGRMFSPARVLEVPFLFKNNAEVDHVRDQLMPRIVEGFRKNGYELLGWTEVGFIYFFSKEPIQSMDDMKKRRIWLWAGDTLGEAFFKASNISPVPLSIVEVYSQLSTSHGAIDTVYISPYGALALQWNTKTKYAANIPMANGIGGLILSRDVFESLSPDLQEILRRTGDEVGRKITSITRKDNDQSIALLKKEGMQFVWGWDQIDHKEVYDLRDRAANYLAESNYIPADYFTETRTLLEAFRLKNEVSASTK